MRLNQLPWEESDTFRTVEAVAYLWQGEYGNSPSAGFVSLKAGGYCIRGFDGTWWPNLDLLSAQAVLFHLLGDKA